MIVIIIIIIILLDRLLRVRCSQGSARPWELEWTRALELCLGVAIIIIINGINGIKSARDFIVRSALMIDFFSIGSVVAWPWSKVLCILLLRHGHSQRKKRAYASRHCR